ncbi:MAG: WD40 repeat domain-containing protein [Firmicutes bacterium]|nr:WD40 repeat domain-containing protein [Bacillota bacterium]
MADPIELKKSGGLSYEIPSGLRMLKTLSAGRESLIYCIAWAPDGAALASGSDDRTIQLWDLETGKRLRTLKGHTDTIFSVAWSPEGKTLASGSQDKTIRLWNVETGEQLRVLQQQTDSIFSVAWAPDGKILASGSADRTIQLWDAETGDKLQKLEGHYDLVYCVAWSPDGLALASGSYDKTIRIWDTKTQKLLLTLQGHTNPVLSVAWAPDGRTLASGSNDKTIRLWDAQTGELINILEGHTEKISAIGFSSDGKLLSSSSPNEDCLWQSGDGKLVTSINKMLKKLRFWGSTAIAFHPSKAIWATLNELGIGIHIWGLDLAALLERPAIPSVYEGNIKTGITGIAGVKSSSKTGLAPQAGSPEPIQRIQDFLLKEKQTGRLLSTVNDLFINYIKTEANTYNTKELFAQFITWIGQAEISGLIRRLRHGNLVLLQPHLLDGYTKAILNTVKEEPDETGCISEAEVWKARFKMASEERIFDTELEKLLLTAALEELIAQEIALREDTEAGPVLIFPALLLGDQPDFPEPAGQKGGFEKVIFEFEGPLQNIFATLVVRLSRCGSFMIKEVWKNAVIYVANKVKGSYGILLRKIEKGRGELSLFFDPAANREMMIQFEDFIRKHLALRARPDSLKRRKLLNCPKCGVVLTEFD